LEHTRRQPPLTFPCCAPFRSFFLSGALFVRCAWLLERCIVLARENRWMWETLVLMVPSQPPSSILSESPFLPFGSWQRGHPSIARQSQPSTSTPPQGGSFVCQRTCFGDIHIVFLCYEVLHFHPSFSRPSALSVSHDLCVATCVFPRPSASPTCERAARRRKTWLLVPSITKKLTVSSAQLSVHFTFAFTAS